MVHGSKTVFSGSKKSGRFFTNCLFVLYDERLFNSKELHFKEKA